MKRTLFLILLPILMLTYGCGSGRAEKESTNISINYHGRSKDFDENQEDYVILDVRTQEEYSEGHILGTICVPNESIGSEAPQEMPDKEQMILVYCRSGNRSKLMKNWQS